MPTPLESLVACGTKLWLDSIDPDLVRSNRALGATGATSNPVIVSDLIKMAASMRGSSNSWPKVATMTRSPGKSRMKLVRSAQDVFRPIYEQTGGNDGYVSFELDPLIEDVTANMPHAQRVARYIELGKKWNAGHTNRMIKVPATPAGLDALEELCAAGSRLT